MPDVVSVLWRLLSVTWLGVPVASFAVLAIGGLMYVAMSRATTTPRSHAMAVHRPGWVARRRARTGIAHCCERVGLGYRRTLFGPVHLTLAELAGHDLAVGGARSGKRHSCGC
jgi:hypothetical protein